MNYVDPATPIYEDTVRALDFVPNAGTIQPPSVAGTGSLQLFPFPTVSSWERKQALPFPVKPGEIVNMTARINPAKLT